MKRHEAALGVQGGVTNLCLIAKALAEAADEAVADGIGAERDAAVRAIVPRLARLCRVDEISYGYDPATLADTYCTLMDECKARAQENVAGVGMLPLKERRPGAFPGKIQHKP